MDKARMIITGVSGLLGNNLAYYFRYKYDILGLFNNHPMNIEGIQTQRADIFLEQDMRRVVNAFEPQVLIHCASMANVDQCEANKVLTRDVNIQGTRNVVDSINKQEEIKLIYISTDSVYDGSKGNFLETDEIHPLNYYGLSKYKGELESLKRSNAIVLRTNIFGWNIQNKKSLGEWVLNELTANRKISCFKDARFSSIYTLELARIIDIAIQRDLKGIYNCGGADSCSKYGFAQKIAYCFELNKNVITPVSIDDFDFKAKRGKNLELNVNKLQQDLDYRLPTIEQSIESFYRDYKAGLPKEIKKQKVKYKENNYFIPYGKQWIDEKDIQAVVSVLRSERITQGPKVEKFENALAEQCGAKYAVAVNSGTSALHIACLAAGISEGNEVITSPVTFVASANCAVYCGAKPIFADIDIKTYNISPKEIEKKINVNTKAIIPVHFAGQSCEMEAIRNMAREAANKYGRKIYIIEDACHALGSLYKGKRVGSCTFSDMTVMSFHPVKHITTGEGGVVLTNDKGLYKKLKLFRSHGITNDAEEFYYDDLAFQPSAERGNLIQNPWYYEQIGLGYNYRITDFQCALGLSQLEKLSEFISQRSRIVKQYNNVFNGHESIQIPLESKHCENNLHLYVLLFDWEKIGMNRALFMIKLKQRGIQTQVHYIPVHTQPYYQKKFNTKWGDCPNAEQYYQKCLSIPLFPAMTKYDTEKVIFEMTNLVGGK